MQARSFSLVSFLVVAACGGGGGGSDGPSAREEANRLDGIGQDLFTAGNGSAVTDPISIPTTGSFDYTGAMLLIARGTINAWGDFNASVDFQNSEVTGDVTNVVQEDGDFFFDGSLTLENGAINRTVDPNDDVTATGTLTGTLTDPSNTEYVVDADVTADFRGDAFNIFFGGFDGGSVTVGSDTVTIDTGQLLGERPTP